MNPTTEQVAQWAREAWQARNPTNAWLADCQSHFERFATLVAAWQAEQDAKRIARIAAKCCDSDTTDKLDKFCAAIRANAPKVTT